MKLKTLFGSATIALGLAAGTGAGAATLTFFGEDVNNSETVPLASTPNADATRTEFRARLTGEGIEDFEGQSGPEPLELTFPGSSGLITAELSGGNGSVQTVAPGTTNTVGRYAISGSNYWDVEAGGAGNFQISFSSDVVAFGFYGIDIGDFGGQLELELGLISGTTQTVSVPTTIGSLGSTGGSVFYFGLLQTDPLDAFRSISFLTTSGNEDVFGFDNFTIGDAAQVTPPPNVVTPPSPNVVPLPAAGWLLLLGVSGLAAASRRKMVA